MRPPSSAWTKLPNLPGTPRFIAAASCTAGNLYVIVAGPLRALVMETTIPLNPYWIIGNFLQRQISGADWPTLRRFLEISSPPKQGI